MTLQLQVRIHFLNCYCGVFNFVIVVAEGKNMPAMDINGFSDCYCILCCEHEYARTSTIDKNLNPYWGEIFSLYVYYILLFSI